MEWQEYRDKEPVYELWLCSCGMGNRQMKELVRACGGAFEAYCADADKWRTVLSEKQAQKLKEHTARWKPREEYEKLRRMGIRLVTMKDPSYPERLREIPDPPYALFLKGELPKDEVPAVAVVGARDCSPYGGYVAERLGAEAARHGVVLVSGMARGIDGISQRAALDAGGVSCAVLGCGVDICYPKENERLYQRLPGQGGVVSPYPPGTPAYAGNFPPRNRIVSGLSDAVVVVEAREKSGTLITVDMALEQGREVYVVPGRITDRLSDGCNRLLRQGATPVTDPGELIRELYEMRERRFGKGRGQNRVSHREDPPENRRREGLTPCLRAVCASLDLTPRTAEEIERRMPEGYGADGAGVRTCLMQLCMENLAVQVSPGKFCAKF